MYIEYRFEAYLQMTVERKEEKVDKPLLTGSAPGGDKFSDICNMETILPETDVLITKRIFSIIHIAKIPISKALNRQRSGQYTAEVRRVESRPATDSNRQVDNFKLTRVGRVKLFNRQRTIRAFSLLDTVTDFSRKIILSTKKLSTVFSVTGSSFEEKQSHQLQYL